MSQTKKGSLVEAITNIVVGVGVSFVANQIILQHYGVPVTLKTNAGITAWFTAISLVRSYALRRLFNRIKRI